MIFKNFCNYLAWDGRGVALVEAPGIKITGALLTIYYYPPDSTIRLIELYTLKVGDLRQQPRSAFYREMVGLPRLFRPVFRQDGFLACQDRGDFRSVG